MIEIIPQSDIATLQSLVRGELVGVSIYETGPSERHDFPLSGPFYYYRGEVVHHHRDGTLTVRFRDCRGWNPVILRFDTTFHAERRLIPGCERYALVPWTKAMERRIKVQRLNHLCGNMGRTGWAHLGEQELDEALALASTAFTRCLDASQEHYRVTVGTLDAVLSVNARAVLSVDAWRYEVTITNKTEKSGVLCIYSTQGSLYDELFAPPVVERLFSSLDEVITLLAEIRETFPAVPKDSTWCSTRYLEQRRQVQ